MSEKQLEKLTNTYFVIWVACWAIVGLAVAGMVLTSGTNPTASSIALWVALGVILLTWVGPAIISLTLLVANRFSSGQAKTHFKAVASGPFYVLWKMLQTFTLF